MHILACIYINSEMTTAVKAVTWLPFAVRKTFKAYPLLEFEVHSTVLAAVIMPQTGLPEHRHLLTGHVYPLPSISPSPPRAAPENHQLTLPATVCGGVPLSPHPHQPYVLFCKSHPNRHEVTSLCGLGLHFPDAWWWWHLFKSMGPLGWFLCPL